MRGLLPVSLAVGRYGNHRRGLRLVTSVLLAFGLAAVISAGQEAHAAGSGGAFQPLAPTRVANTVNGIGGLGSTPFANGETRSLILTGLGGVPTSNVSAVVLELNSSNATTAGSITIYSDDLDLPAVSTLAYSSNRSYSTFTIADIGSDGGVKITNQIGDPDLSLTVEGYFTADGSTPGAGGYMPVSPTRILDTTGTPLAAGATISLDVAGQNGVPTSANAFFANLTISPVAGGSGGVTIWPMSQSEPTVSTVRWNNTPASSGATIDLDSTGTIYLHNTGNAAINVMVDLAGYFAAGGSNGGNGFFPASDLLYRSTDPGSAPLDGLSGLRINIADVFPDLTDAENMSAVAVTIAVTGTTAAGAITAYSPDESIPNTTTLQYLSGQDASVLTLTSTDVGALELYNSGSQAVNLSVYAEGYFSNTAATPAPYFVEGPEAHDCTPDPVLSVEYLSPLGQESTAFASGDGTIVSYDDGSDDGPLQLTLPPSGFQPLNATDAELALWDIPARPTDPSALADWQNDYTDFQGFYVNPPCQEAGSHFSSIPALSENEPNYVGVQMFKNPTYDQVKGIVIAPALDYCPSHSGSYSSWVGISDFGARLEQAGLTLTSDQSEIVPFWEQLNTEDNPPNGYDLQSAFAISIPVGQHWKVWVHHFVGANYTIYHFHSVDAHRDFSSVHRAGHDTYGTPNGVEAIQERPSTGSVANPTYLPLANFGTNAINDVSDSWAAGQWGNITNQDPDWITMRSNGNLLAHDLSHSPNSYQATWDGCN